MFVVRFPSFGFGNVCRFRLVLFSSPYVPVRGGEALQKGLASDNFQEKTQPMERSLPATQTKTKTNLQTKPIHTTKSFNNQIEKKITGIDTKQFFKHSVNGHAI